MLGTCGIERLIMITGMCHQHRQAMPPVGSSMSRNNLLEMASHPKTNLLWNG
jgi:hypothetical protein